MARMAGNKASWAIIAGLGLLVAAPPAGCVPDAPTNPLGVDPTEVLTAAGDAVILPTLERFSESSAALSTALTAWSDALASGDGIAERDAARAAWVDAMDIWQELELMQVGPAGSSLTVTGGADLRDEIYSWPTVNPCRVDQETVEASWDEASFFDDNLVNSYGLDAIEHLLWAGPDNICPGQVPINADGTWDALGPDGISANRASYAVALSAQVTSQVEDLIGRWQGEFSLLTAYESDQQALNAIYNALYYLELKTKDRKLGEPLGLGDCQSECAELVESLESGTSTQWVEANLRGFRALFTASELSGMEDLLRQTGQVDLADQVVAELDAADAAAAALGMPIDEALVDNAEQVTELYDAVRRVGDLFKGDVATVLLLEIPVEGAGDLD